MSFFIYLLILFRHKIRGLALTQIYKLCSGKNTFIFIEFVLLYTVRFKSP